MTFLYGSKYVRTYVINEAEMIFYSEIKILKESNFRELPVLLGSYFEQNKAHLMHLNLLVYHLWNMVFIFFTLLKKGVQYCCFSDQKRANVMIYFKIQIKNKFQILLFTKFLFTWFPEIKKAEEERSILTILTSILRNSGIRV